MQRMHGEAYHGIKSWMKYDVTVVGDGKRIAIDSQLSKQQPYILLMFDQEAFDKQNTAMFVRPLRYLHKY